MKKLLALLLALVMVFALVACGGGDDDVAADPTPSVDINDATDDDVKDNDAVKSDYVRPVIKMEAKDSNVNPLAMRSSGVISYSVYEMLYTSENGIGSKMVPWLVDGSKGGNNEIGLAGMDHEVGSGVYTFYIYDYIKDSAGNTITAEDVVFSFEQTKAFGQASGWGAIEKWEAVNATTFKMICKNDLNTKGELENILLRCFIFSKKAYEASGSQFTADACGTGRYEVTSFTQDAAVTLTKKADYWQTNEELIPRAAWANVEKIEITISSDNNSLVMALQSGDLDMLSQVPLASVGGLEGDKRFDIYTYPQNGIHYLEPNCSADSIMSNKDLRLAVFYAISNENLAKVLNAAGGTSTQAYYPISAFGHDLFGDYPAAWDNQTNYVTEYNKDKVEQYKKAAGYNGEEIKLLHGDNTGMVENMINMLTEAGFNIKNMQLDRNAVNNLYADSKGWDLYYNATNSSDYLTNLFDHAFNNGGEGPTKNFINDETLNGLMKKAYAVGATDEDVDALWQHCVENAYTCPLLRNVNAFVMPKGSVDSVWRNDKNTFIPGAANWVEG